MDLFEDGLVKGNGVWPSKMLVKTIKIDFILNDLMEDVVFDRVQ